ncbi:MAG: cadherin-like beta sandwich domain-containing protein [Spirochaetaceae bacterium]|jgi:hypothetical protein|nr:cadherin-like beta sandwich domain-containing protein [Spirochaetaceae bacterium]
MMTRCFFRWRAGILAFTFILIFFAGCEQPRGGDNPNVTLDSNATPYSLSVSAGNLRPTFSPNITAYTVTVNHRVETIKVTLAVSSKAQVSYPNGVPLPIVTGSNKISLTVNAEDGTKRTYSVTVRRLSDATVSIGTAGDLAKIGIDDEYPLAGNYALAADLELAGWTPIGPNEENAFTGNFDGAGHTITLSSIAGSAFVNGSDAKPAVYLGVFGYTKGSAEIKALVKNITVITGLDHSITKKGEYYVGALAGCAGEYTELSGITVKGSLSFSNDYAGDSKGPVYVGGIAGALIASALRNSSNDADIYAFGKAGNGAYNYAGGLVGIFDRNALTRGTYYPNVIQGAPFAGSSIVNCSNTGNVSGETDGSATNVFAGGIAGGSCYGFKTYYSGRIEDCWSTGNVSAGGGGYWSFAGGIAGTICGDGDGYDSLAGAPDDSTVTGPTRIVRCYATGDVKTNGPSGSWPYVGGIVGYNYYGAVVARCYFSGDVSSEGEGYDYTGGIAGYNSQLGGHPSTIEDCWSSGTVSGRINAGGIVGQNQVHAITRRCYSTAALTVRAPNGAIGNLSQQGAGGIAGYNAGTVRNCAALNPSITSTGGFSRVYRVVGDAPIGGLENNAAFSGMVITISPDPNPPNSPEAREPDPGADAKDGADSAKKPVQSVYAGLGWDFTNVWKMGSEGYPILRWQD